MANKANTTKSQNLNPEGKEPGENWSAQPMSGSAGRTLPHQQEGAAHFAEAPSLTISPPPPLPLSLQKTQGNCSLIFDGLATVFYSTMYITLPIWICKMVKIQPPEKITWKGKKIIRQLRMAIIHPYLCFGKKHCPRGLALLITLSSVWGLNERRFRVHCWWFPRVFLSVIKTNARLLIERTLSLLG